MTLENRKLKEEVSLLKREKERGRGRGRERERERERERDKGNSKSKQATVTNNGPGIEKRKYTGTNVADKL